MQRLCLAALLASVAVGCTHPSSNDWAADPDIERQVAAYNEQLVAVRKQIEQGDELIKAQEQQSLRLEKLLSRWEEHARRADAILDVIDKATGTKP